MPLGIVMSGLPSPPPASSSNTRLRRSADRRLATTQPAAPAPTMMSSNHSSASTPPPHARAVVYRGGAGTSHSQGRHANQQAFVHTAADDTFGLLRPDPAADRGALLTAASMETWERSSASRRVTAAASSPSRRPSPHRPARQRSSSTCWPPTWTATGWKTRRRRGAGEGGRETVRQCSACLDESPSWLTGGSECSATRARRRCSPTCSSTPTRSSGGAADRRPLARRATSRRRRNPADLREEPATDARAGAARQRPAALPARDARPGYRVGRGCQDLDAWRSEQLIDDGPAGAGRRRPMTAATRSP